MPMVDRLTEDAHADRRGQHDHARGQAARRPQHRRAGFQVALDRLVGKQKMPRQAVVLGAGGGARAVVYGLITEGFQRIVVFNRHLHRAEGLVKHFGRSAAHMELRGDALARVDHRVGAGQDEGPRQRDVDRADRATRRRSRPRRSTATCSCST